jgi:hypothetical protein
METLPMRTDPRPFLLTAARALFLAALVPACATQPLLDGNAQDAGTMPDLTPPPNACVAANGYCAPAAKGGPPPCRTGFEIGVAVEQAHPDACSPADICCVPACNSFTDPTACTGAGCQWEPCPPNAECVGANGGVCVDSDCRTLGCPDPNTVCAPCWAGYGCLPPGAVC